MRGVRMTRKETLAEGVTLYLGDCREILPTLGKVDAIISDPPYGIKHNGTRSPKSSISSTGRRQSKISIVGDNDPFDPAPFLESSSVACFTGAQHFAERLPGGTYHVWNKRGPYDPLHQSDGDLIWISGEKRALRIVDLVWRGICRTTENADQIVHPTQKPVALMDWCIRWIGPKAIAIVDPFMGSGTTGVAAVKLSRKFIGIEISPAYFDIACKRIQAALDAPDMFIETPKSAKQEAFEL